MILAQTNGSSWSALASQYPSRGSWCFSNTDTHPGSHAFAHTSLDRGCLLPHPFVWLEKLLLFRESPDLWNLPWFPQSKGCSSKRLPNASRTCTRSLPSAGPWAPQGYSSVFSVAGGTYSQEVTCPIWLWCPWGPVPLFPRWVPVVLEATIAMQ